MTVQDTTNIKRVNGDGNTDEFTFTFRVLQNADLKVYIVDANNDKTLQTENTNYELSLESDGEGGTVDFSIGTTPTATEDVLMVNEVDLTQTADLPTEGNFNETAVETALDRVVLQNIQQEEEITRCLKITQEDPENDDDFTGIFLTAETAATRASKLLAFNSTGDGLISSALSSLSSTLDTLFSGLASGDFIKYNGTSWVNRTASEVLTDLSLNNETNIKATLGLTDPAFDAYASQAEAEAGTSQVKVMNPLRVSQAIAALAPTAVYPKFKTCFEMSQDTDTDHDILIGAGAAVDSTGADMMILSTAITKQIDASWAVGDDAGGLDGTESVAGTPDNSTWYHLYLIKRSDTGVVDAIFSETGPSSGPTLPTNYDYYRWIGAVLTDGSGNITDFTKNGEDWLWADPPLDVDDSSIGTTAETAVLSAPTGLKTEATVHAFLTGNGYYMYVSSPDANDEQASATAAPLSNVSNGAHNNNSNQIQVWLNTSAQVRYRVNNASATNVRIATLGWRAAENV